MESTSSGERKLKLLDQVRQALQLRHYSQRTADSYVARIRQFILFHGKRHPSDMAEAEVVAFLTDLAVAGQVSASTQNQALAAVVFVYRHVRQKPSSRKKS